MAKMTDVVTLRLPHQVKKEWQERAKKDDVNLGDWIRKKVDTEEAVLTRKPTPEKGRKLKFTKADPALISKIAKVGNNLNQISRWCNIHKSNAEAMEILKVLLQIKSELKGISDAN